VAGVSCRSWVLVFGLALVGAACGSDDGAEVREIDGGEAGSESASASGSGGASGSASAPASGSESAPAAADGDGDYAYVSDVGSHRLLVLDICEIAQLLDADSIDYDAVEKIYREGGNSVNADGSIRSIGDFAASEDRLHGLDTYYGTPTPLDDFATAALDGTAMFEGRSDAVRAQGIEKGIQNQVMVAWLDHELASALAKSAADDIDPTDGAPHNWDEGWAFYHGAEPSCAPYATADKRAENFGTLADDGTTGQANEIIVAAMNAGRDALIAGDAAAAEAAAAEVRRGVFITYSQAAIRYATLAADDLADSDDEAAEEHQVEGLAFWRVIEAAATEAGADVEAVNGILGLDNPPGANGGGDEIRAALAPAWTELGISDADIGELG